MEIIDADGHVNDHACGDEIAAYMPKGNQMAKLFPEFDHLHFRYLKQTRRATGNPSPDDWNRFLDNTGIGWTVLYPTAGLAIGRIVAPEWAVIACSAYNNWLHETFINKNSRLEGMALIPFQDIDAAVNELRRAVRELRMLGGMLPSNGEAIQGHFGNKIYWPLYEEAEKLLLKAREMKPGDPTVYTTLAGFVLAQLGHLPTTGESFRWRGLRFEVVDMDGRRIDKLLVQRLAQQA